MGTSYKILSIDAKDIYSAMRQVDKKSCGYNIRNKDGLLNLRKFTNTLDWSLDSMNLEKIHDSKGSACDFGFRSGNHMYTTNVICVTFKYSYKVFNRVTENVYVKKGYSIQDCEFVDCVSVRDGELIAIRVGEEVESPVSQKILGEYFVYDGRAYQQDGAIETVAGRAEIRDYLYKYGFDCDGVHYVRYKRSSGSSRVGKCLFVNSELFDKADNWDKCGLNIINHQEIDLAAWEAYISLPMSSIIDTIEVPLDSILVIDDYESVFRDDVIAVEIENEHLVSSQKNVEIKNSIWDGQSLMDESLFGKYKDKGMLLLRNRFFKSCCFNTKIQQWFADNGITSVDQLNGFTLAKDISQVKLITTPSSIKFAKFGKIEDWMRSVDPIFGIVKYEKKPHAFDGRLIQTHYQLLNTLQLSYKEMEEVLRPSFEYISAIRKDPAVFRYAIHYPRNDQSGKFRSVTSKNEAVFKMLSINDKFADTRLYQRFRDNFIRGEMRSLKRGHVLVNGNYSTLMGNGMEMLQASVGKFNGEPVLGVGNIRTTRFAPNKTILCSRSPHVTMGNVLLSHNVACELYDKYFNTTECIVCVNAIGENIQQRLNGCDYDSDTMLITDDELLIEVAQRNYDKFLVPTNLTTSIKTKRRYTQSDKADLDVKTSVNKIGEIINLSQQLNSLLWDKVSKGASIAECAELYQDICKLSVLSNVEIDRAKKEFVINSAIEIKLLQSKYKIVRKNKTVKPMFFKMITTENGFDLSDSVQYEYFETPMDYLQRAVSCFNFRRGRKKKTAPLPFMSVVKAPDLSSGLWSGYKRKDRIIDLIRSSFSEMRKLFVDYQLMSKGERENVWILSGEIKQRCIDEIEKISEDPIAMYLVLKLIDNNETRDVAQFMFEVLFGKPNENFFKMIDESKEEVYTLEESQEGTIVLYGFSFKKAPLINKKFTLLTVC